MATNNATNNWSPLTTKGDLFTYDTAPNRLGIGSNYYYPMADSSQSLGLSYQLPIFQPQVATYFNTDFLGNNNGDGSLSTNAVGTGAAAAISASIDGVHPGLFKLSMGTTTTGRSNIFQPGEATNSLLSNSVITLETCIYLSALSNGTDTYTFTFGTANIAPGDGTVTNGVYVSYNSGVNSGNFVLTAISASTSTTTNTSTTWTGAASFYKLRLVINGTTSATLYGAAAGSDFVSLGTVSSNLPTTALVLWLVSMVKSAGTTSEFAYVDYVNVKIVPNTIR